MELKYGSLQRLHTRDRRFNRTFMELKLSGTTVEREAREV